mmetsp:Transcript_6946/g.13880  ORF Transcript_6946/g.13880 Transcript_6946/m.13880 type:complete len:87 (+) Transcript_6946:608-868(+)
MLSNTVNCIHQLVYGAGGLLAGCWLTICSLARLFTCTSPHHPTPVRCGAAPPFPDLRASAFCPRTLDFGLLLRRQQFIDSLKPSLG